MRRFWVLTVLGFLVAGDSSVRAGEINSLSDAEAKAGFELVFNGKNLDGWQQNGNWKVEDGVIARTDKGGSLTYTTANVPDDFELRFEWKVAEGSNSGVYYRPGQYEYQILDNDGHSNGTNPRTTAASLYFCMAPSHDATKPVGKWNTGRIVGKGTVIQHWLNGKKVIDFDYTDSQWKENVKKLKIRGADLSARGGKLWLQDHGDPVWFRSIRWREIPADDEIAHETVPPAEVPEAERKAEEAKLQRIRESRQKKNAQ